MQGHLWSPFPTNVPHQNAAFIRLQAKRTRLFHDVLAQTLPRALTHWGRDKIAKILQTTFPNAFPSMKIFEFRLIFHWSLFLNWTEIIISIISNIFECILLTQKCYSLYFGMLKHLNVLWRSKMLLKCVAMCFACDGHPPMPSSFANRD